MGLDRDETGKWTLQLNEEESAREHESHSSYWEALPRYLSALDTVFTRARERSEFQFLWSLLGIRGMQDAGWDPYETSVEAINGIRELHRNNDNPQVDTHLALWLYCHIIEASEPYEFLANLIDIAIGGTFKVERFVTRKGNIMSPSAKITQIEADATKADMAQVALPIRESWNANLRNAVFHSDYTIYGSEVRTLRPPTAYGKDEWLTLVNRAIAHHEAMQLLRCYHTESYEEPTEIEAHSDFGHGPAERAVVIVRDGEGATGLKAAWTEEEIAAGNIAWRVGRFTVDEMKLLDADPTLERLPERPERERTKS